MNGLLAVIPARRGSKGIPGKALRTVAGVPLVLRTLRTVEASRVAERIVVSTDWPELRDFCELRGYETLERPTELATDEAPLAGVAEHAVDALDWQGTVGLFQPTCPLLRPETIRDVTERYVKSGADWGITTHPDPHIHWREGGLITPRKNRQQLDTEVESGAVQLMSAEYARTQRGSTTSLPISEREALDVDTPDDLLLAERLAGLRRIHFVVAVGHEVGTGHYHRCRHLARLLSHHDLSWEWVGQPDLRRIPSFIRCPALPRTSLADITVFDRLQVPREDLLMAKSEGQVVVLEDEGAESGKLADLRINEMLDRDHLRYAVLREEFVCLPEREHSEIARKVLVTFGGTDPAGLGARVGHELGGIARVIEPGTSTSMAREMRDADLVVTGQGRTVFEAAACGTPCISLAANEREARHVRIPGVTYLGLNSTVPPNVLSHAVWETLNSKALREEMARTARANFDDRGADRLARAIEELT